MLRLSTNQLRGHASAIVLLVFVLGTGCSFLGFSDPSAPSTLPRSIVDHRTERLDLEVKRLRADLLRAEEALVTVESGMRGNYTRANAVSELAEARILVKRAKKQAPWRVEEFLAADNKLVEAERHVQRDNPGAALFFVYRARRIAELALLEAESVSAESDTYFVVGDRVNLRVGPSTRAHVLLVLNSGTPVFAEGSRGQWLLVRVFSGSAGWIHKNLVRR